MKKLVTTLGSASAGQTYPEESFKHIQDANQDGENAMVLAIIEQQYGSYTTNDVIILRGMKVTAGSPTSPGACTITAGSFYYNGEIYQCSGFSATITGSNVVVMTLMVADDATAGNYLGIDPTPFTDSSTHYVHFKGEGVLTQAGTGTGTKDYSVMKPLYRTRDHQVRQVSSLLIDSTYGSGFTNLISGTDVKLTTPNDGITRRYIVTAKIILDNGASASNSDYAQFRIQNTSDSLTYDQSAAGKAITESISMYQTLTMSRCVDIGPNKTVAFQCYNFAGANMNGQYVVLELTEI